MTEEGAVSVEHNGKDVGMLGCKGEIQPCGCGGGDGTV